MATRRSNKIKRRRRGRFGLAYKLLSALLILVVVTAGCAVFFRVNVITAEGSGRYSQEEVIAASGLEPGDNLFLLPVLTSARSILKALPYIDEVSIQTKLPDGVHIMVTDCIPAARFSSGGTWWVVDSSGKVLEQGLSGQADKLPLLQGLTVAPPQVGNQLTVEETSQESQLLSIIDLLTALEERGMLTEVTYLDLTSFGEIHFDYDGRFTVEVGLNADYSWKLRTLQQVLDNLQINETGNIDLTREDKAYFDPR